MKKSKKKVKRHLKIKSFLILISIVLVIFFLGYYVVSLPIKNIYIKGNDKISDYDILVATGLKDYPPMFKYSKKSLASKLLAIPNIANVKIQKDLKGTIILEVEEARILFFNRNDKKYVLENHKTLDNSKENVPFLINYVPDTIYNRLIDSMKDLSTNTLALISEIEYSPSKSGDVTIDDTRFLLRMNDGNNVYINLINIKRLNMYLEISTIFPSNGTLGLDSDNGQVVFNAF